MKLSENNIKKINDYKMLCYVNYYIYNIDIQEILKMCDEYPYEECILFSDRFLVSLGDFVLFNMKYKIIDGYSKENVSEILSYMRSNKRFNNEEERVFYINKYNDIIRNLNSTIGETNYGEYVLSELSSRVYNQRGLTINNVELYEDLFRESFAYDIRILESLSKPKEEFNQFAKSMVADEFYFASIIKFSKDIPEIFEDDEICSRIKYIFELNKHCKELYFTAPSTMYRNAKTLRLVKNMKSKK